MLMFFMLTPLVWTSLLNQNAIEASPQDKKPQKLCAWVDSNGRCLNYRLFTHGDARWADLSTCWRATGRRPQLTGQVEASPPVRKDGQPVCPLTLHKGDTICAPVTGRLRWSVLLPNAARAISLATASGSCVRPRNGSWATSFLRRSG